MGRRSEREAGRDQQRKGRPSKRMNQWVTSCLETARFPIKSTSRWIAPTSRTRQASSRAYLRLLDAGRPISPTMTYDLENVIVLAPDGSPLAARGTEGNATRTPEAFAAAARDACARSITGGTGVGVAIVPAAVSGRGTDTVIVAVDAVPLRRALVPIEELVLRTMDLFIGQAQSSSIELRVKHAPSIPPFCTATERSSRGCSRHSSAMPFVPSGTQRLEGERDRLPSTLAMMRRTVCSSSPWRTTAPAFPKGPSNGYSSAARGPDARRGSRCEW